jgi:hypothetical protein
MLGAQLLGPPQDCLLGAVCLGPALSSSLAPDWCGLPPSAEQPAATATLRSCCAEGAGGGAACAAAGVQVSCGAHRLVGNGRDPGIFL